MARDGPRIAFGYNECIRHVGVCVHLWLMFGSRLRLGLNLGFGCFIRVRSRGIHLLIDLESGDKCLERHGVGVPLLRVL